ncbi:MAG: [Fe-Fe] hydrogenase large subunit C-terminal domain-containing protein [Bacteroidales bacterium]
MGISDVDAVLTTREFVKFIRLFGINIHDKPETADTPLGIRSSAGKLFGNTGGVAEAAIRRRIGLLTGEELVKFRIPEIRGLKGHKETRIKIGDMELGVAVVNGLANARILMDEIKSGKKGYPAYRGNGAHALVVAWEVADSQLTWMKMC